MKLWSIWIKMEMYSGRICTVETLKTQEEADAANAKLKAARSLERWVQSLKELGEYEAEHEAIAESN